jgi:hypothetical protein
LFRNPEEGQGSQRDVVPVKMKMMMMMVMMMMIMMNVRVLMGPFNGQNWAANVVPSEHPRVLKHPSIFTTISESDRNHGNRKEEELLKAVGNKKTSGWTGRRD